MLTIGLFISLCVGASSCQAASGAGEMGVNLIDPTTMDFQEAQQLCAEEPALVKCEIVQEMIKINKAFDTQELALDNKHVVYDVFNANFE